MSNSATNRIAKAYARVGEVKKYKNQTYQCVEVEPYTRRDGTESVVLVWETACADCGRTFSFTTPNRRWFSPSRRCQSHRRPGVTPRPPIQQEAATAHS